MNDSLLQSVQQKRSALQQQRRPVSQLQAAQVETEAIQQFVKTALHPDHRWFIPSSEQSTIVKTLNEIRQLFKTYYEDCRTPEHFQRAPQRFLELGNRISHLSYCIHLSLDQGFFGIEPKGLTPRESVSRALERLDRLHDSLQGQTWKDLPIPHQVEEEFVSQFEQIYSEQKPKAQDLLNRPDFGGAEKPLTVEQLEAAYALFQGLRPLQEMEEQLLESVLKGEHPHPPSPAPSIESILRRLKNLQQSLTLQHPPKPLHDPKGRFPLTVNDLRLQLGLLQVPLAPLQYLSDLSLQLGGSRNPSGFAERHLQKATQEQQDLQMFNGKLDQVLDSLRQVNSILGNLAVSFGKLYYNASPKRLQAAFLKKVLTTIRGLLRKALQIFDSHHRMLLESKELLEKMDLVVAFVKGLTETISEIEQARNEISQYEMQLGGLLEDVDSTPKATSAQLYQWLQQAYEARTSVASACMVLGNVEMMGELLSLSIDRFQDFYAHFDTIKAEHTDPAERAQALKDFLATPPSYQGELLKAVDFNAEALEWVVNEVLESSFEEERLFVETAEEQVLPVKLRVKSLQATEAPRVGGTRDANSPEEKRPAHQIQRMSTGSSSGDADPLKALKSMQQGRPSARYDPFPPNVMDTMRRVTRRMRTPKGDMLYYILTHTHVMFDSLDKSEASYNMPNTTVTNLERALHASKTANDFIVNFAKLKLLTHGYYNSHSKEFVFDEAKKRFDIPAQVDKFLMLNKGAFETPKGLFDRLVRIMLKMDDAKLVEKVMTEQAFAILKSDFILSDEEAQQIQDELAML